MIFVASCRSVERSLTCAAIENYQIKPVESCVVSIKFNTCYCAPFDVNYWATTGDYIKQPLEYCDGIEGVRVEDSELEIRPKFNALQRLRKESCK